MPGTAKGCAIARAAIQRRIEHSDGHRFTDRLQFGRCAFWDALPAGHIPPPTERSYPPSSWRLIEEYAARYG